MAPVHLQPDWDRLRLFQFRKGELSLPLQRQLLESLQSIFDAEGMESYLLGDLDWVLRSPQQEEITTTPIDWATGVDLSRAMPTGEGALRWKRLLNEAQMVLHTVDRSPAAAALPVNGIWVWRDPTLWQRLQHRWNHWHFHRS